MVLQKRKTKLKYEIVLYIPYIWLEYHAHNSLSEVGIQEKKKKFGVTKLTRVDV